MFSGIIEATAQISDVLENQGNLVVKIPRPGLFADIKLGDSIAVDGVCLTVEGVSPAGVQFSMGPETLKILHWSQDYLLGRTVNLERSLVFGDRLHGHMVSGHVEGLGKVMNVHDQVESRTIEIQITKEIKEFVWIKGSVALNGVSLTINTVQDQIISVCIIPETLKRTNLVSLVPGDRVNIETDYLAKIVLRAYEEKLWSLIKSKS